MSISVTVKLLAILCKLDPEFVQLFCCCFFTTEISNSFYEVHLYQRTTHRTMDEILILFTLLAFKTYYHHVDMYAYANYCEISTELTLVIALTTLTRQETCNDLTSHKSDFSLVATSSTNFTT